MVGNVESGGFQNIHVCSGRQRTEKVFKAVAAAVGVGRSFWIMRDAAARGRLGGSLGTAPSVTSLPFACFGVTQQRHPEFLEYNCNCAIVLIKLSEK